MGFFHVHFIGSHVCICPRAGLATYLGRVFLVLQDQASFYLYIVHLPLLYYMLLCYADLVAF